MEARSLFPVSPSIPDRFPSLWSIVGKSEGLFFRCFPTYAFDDPIAVQRILHERFILLNGPDEIARVMVNHTDNYVRSGFWNKQLDPLLGLGLVVSQGDTWRRQRRATLPAFRPRSLVRHACITLAEARRWLDVLQACQTAGQVLCGQFQVLALRTAARSLLSIELGDRDEPMLKVLATFAELMTEGGFADLALPGWVPTALNRDRAAVHRAWFGWIDRLIEERLAASSPAEPDLVSACLADNQLSPTSRAELRDQVSTFLVTSYETTGYALRWAACLLAADTRLQDGIAAELDDADLGATFAMDVKSAANTLPQLRAAIRETLRLYPPTKVFGRDAVGNDRLGSVQVRKGDRIVISPWVLHRHRRLWDRPDEFRPQRFLPDAPDPPRFAYLPFGAGPRVCIGAAMATLTITIVLAALLQQFRIARADDQAVMPRALGAGMVPYPMPSYRVERRLRRR